MPEKKPSLRERVQRFRSSLAQRQEQSKQGATRSGRVIGRARSGIQRGRSTLSYARAKTHKLKEIQQKHGGSLGFALGKEFRQATPRFNPLKRKKGVRE